MLNRAAPTSSVPNTIFNMEPVIRTIPPTWWAEMASCMVLRCIRLILRPDSMAMDRATVTTPRPPI